MQLKEGQEDAARYLCDRYFDDLARIAQRKMRGQISASFDEEDVALSVLNAICIGAKSGQFPSIVDRNDLWGLLMAVTRHKIVDRVRFHGRQKRGGSDNHIVFSAFADGESRQWKLDDLLVDPDTPDFFAVLKDECRSLLEALRNDTLRAVAEAMLRGESIDSVAARLGIAPRSVQRKLRLVQSKWASILLAKD